MGIDAGMTDTIRDNEITSQEPTEDDEDLDAPGEGGKDTGDEGGDDSGDTGDVQDTGDDS